MFILKRNHRALYILLLSGFLAPSLCKAQQATLRGWFTDSLDQGVARVRVQLLSGRDSLTKIELTDLQGQFVLPRPTHPAGFTITAEAPGYELLRIPSSQWNPPYRYRLKSARQLATVTVKARREAIEITPTLIGINVEASPLLATGNTADMLAKIPRVMLDPLSRALSVDGRTNLVIFVNNRQILLNGDQITRYLESLPAANISRVEINTQPSARYDAQAGAVISIFLKKNQQEGLGGELTLSPGVGRYEKFSVPLSLSYRRGKLSGYTLVNAGWNRSYFGYTMHQYFKDNSTDVDSYRIRKYLTTSIKNGLDWQISPTLTVGLILNGLYQNDTFTPTSTTDLRLNGTNQRITANNNMASVLKNISEGLSIKKEFPRAKSTLSFDADAAHYQETTTSSAAYQIDTDANWNQLRTRFPYQVQIGSLKGDFTKKWDKLTLETGGKLSRVRINTQPTVEAFTDRFAALVPNLIAPFNYNENISALYGNASYRLGPWSIQAGLRAEHSDVSGISGDNKLVTRYRFWSGFPSASLQYTTPSKYTYTLTVNRRISRPNFTYLNPANVFVDPFTLIVGNPTLRPQFYRLVQAGVTTPKRISLIAFYQEVSGRIFEVVYRADSSGRLQNTYLNFDHERRLQSTLTIPITFTKNWRSTLSATGSYAEFASSFRQQTLVSQPTFILQWFHSLKLGNWNGDVSITGRSKTALGYMMYSPLLFVNLGIGRSLWNNQGALKIAYNDVFHSIVINNYGQYIGTDVNYRHINETRVLTLNLSYKFGNQKMKAVGRKNAASTPEIERYKEN